MITIKTSRHPLKFYLFITLVSIFYFVMTIAILSGYLKKSSKSYIPAKVYFMPVFAIATFAMALYTVYQGFKNAPKIVADKEKISFNNDVYYWKQLKNVELTGKQPYRYLTIFPMEGANFTFDNGDIKYIFDDAYINSWEVKSFIKQVIIDKKDSIEVSTKKVETTEIETDYFETFKGNQLTSLRGILLWGIIGFIIFIIFKTKKPPSVGIEFFAVGYCIFWFMIFSLQMHYFQLSQTLFLVKNHNLYWRKKAFRLADIKEIVFETQGKAPNGLRVITNDFRNKVFYAGTLSNKTWVSLKQQLEMSGINVRDELHLN